jgi:uncharacterized protein
MKYVLLYRAAPDALARVPEHFPAHMVRARDFHDRRALLMLGTFADVVSDGSMAIFASREAAEEFVAGDPFVEHGVVAEWEIREWDEVLAE